MIRRLKPFWLSGMIFFKSRIIPGLLSPNMRMDPLGHMCMKIRNLLLKAMVVEEEALPAVKGRLSLLSVQEMQNAGVRSMETDIQERGTAGAVNFRRDTGSFSCDMRVSKPEMAFFSVPYDSGWKANVNGRPVEIIKTAGMMSVPLDEGNNHVTFTYRPPALILGAACSAVSILTLGLYVLLALRFKKRKENKGCQPCIW